LVPQLHAPVGAQSAVPGRAFKPLACATETRCQRAYIETRIGIPEIAPARWLHHEMQSAVARPRAGASSQSWCRRPRRRDRTPERSRARARALRAVLDARANIGI